MIDFRPISIEDKKYYEKLLADGRERGCEYSFANLYLWGRQNMAVMNENIVFFSQFNRRSVYPFPLGAKDKKAILDAIIRDARERGIPCRITGIYPEDKQLLDELYPDKFRYHCDRDAHDYVYDINDLADLAGRKYHSKRNHIKRFESSHPDYRTEPIGENNIPSVIEMAEAWYEAKLLDDPHADFHMERAALLKALRKFDELELEGLVIKSDGKILAMTMGSLVSTTTVDVHFEKALSGVDGAYTIINREFARHIRSKYPEVKYLNREEDMGIEGLRRAKQSYYPHHMITKCWACLLEEGYDY